MLTNTGSLKFFLLLLLVAFAEIWPSESSNIEIGSELNPQQLVSQMSEEDKASLTQYFKMMLLESQGGYVLFGIKPICLEAVPIIEASPRSNFGFYLQMRTSIERKGLEAWNRLPISKQDSPIDIVVYNQSDQGYYFGGFQHVLWIHREAFLDAVNKNLALFKFILGPETSAELLLNKLCDPQASFSFSLAHNRVLIGIVLGFGVENAITGSRLEIIEKAMREVERIPLARRSSRAGTSLSSQHPSLEFMIPSMVDEPRPSFGFQTLSEELNTLQKQMTLSTKLVERFSPPIPHFGCLKNDIKTTELLTEYAKAQTKIQSLLLSNSFLEDALTLILGNEPRQIIRKTIAAQPSSEAIISKLKCDNRNKELADQVGLLIWNNIFEKDSFYVDQFIVGMQAAENDWLNQKGAAHERTLPSFQPFYDFQVATMVKYGHDNVKEGEKAIKTLAEDPDTVEIINGKLYYKIVQSGHGPKLTINHDRAAMEYLLYYFGGRNSGKLLIASSPSNLQDDMLNLYELIPGLAHGVLGMQVGEIREIYIHPDYAYGYKSHFEPGVAIKAQVELIFLPPTREGASIKFPALHPVDIGLTDFPKPISESQMEELKSKSAHAEGYSAWWFYGLGSDGLYSLNDVIASLKRRQNESGVIDATATDFVPLDLLRVLYERQEKLLLKE